MTRVPTDELSALRSRRICHACVREEYLSNEIQSKGRRGRCYYCGKVARSIKLEDLGERIAAAFERHYVRTSDQPTPYESSLLSDKESDYDWERQGDPVVDAIMNAAEIPENAAEDIQQILEDENQDYEAAKMGEETEFATGSYYEEKGISDEWWQDEWREFEHALKTEARYFSGNAVKHLESVFADIETMRTEGGRTLLVDAGPGTRLTRLYRARVFQSDERLEAALMRPDQQLGSPPSLMASAGRMNARGISVFYGANDPAAALAEVRPPVGSQVAVARFEIIRPIRLLDLAAFKAVRARGSIFDPEFARRLEKAAFLRSLSRRMTKAVMPDDEAFDYLATQAVADFLATWLAVQIDGIIFPSAQAKLRRSAQGRLRVALNVVLFHKAARVKAIELPEGTELNASLGQMYEEGYQREYTVFEMVPREDPDATDQRTRSLLDDAALLDFLYYDEDYRSPTLQIDVDSVTVHVVQAIKLKTAKHLVRRHRRAKLNPAMFDDPPQDLLLDSSVDD